MSDTKDAHALDRAGIEGANISQAFPGRPKRQLSIAFVITPALYDVYSSKEDRLGSDYVLFSSLQNHPSNPEVSIVPLFLDPETAYIRHDILIMKSCWEYHLDGVKTEQWLTKFMELQESTTRSPLMLNCPEMLLWNLKKGTYLLELQTAGFKIPETRVINSLSGNGGLLADLEASSDTSQETIWGSEGAVVIKPMISASGYCTFKFSRGDIFTTSQLGMIEKIEKELGGVLVQEYVREIMAGEWSMIYIDGTYSHSVLKVPCQGVSQESNTQEFRCQRAFGGTLDDAHEPPQVARDTGDKLIRWLGEKFGRYGIAYVRVDGVLRNAAHTKLEPGQLELVIMEVECIEPCLYWDRRAGDYGLARFVDKVIFAVKE